MRFPQTQKPPLGSQINWSHPLSKGLVACYLMNEGSGDKIYDLSGNNNVGTLIGMNNTTGGWSPGIKGQALKFDGSDDCVTASSNNFLGLIGKAYTISLWIQDDTSAAILATFFHRIVSFANGVINIQLGLGTDSVGAYRSFYISESFDSITKKQSASVGTGWFNVIATSNGSTHKLYVNGALDEGGSGGSPGPFITNTGLLYIGQRGNNAGYVKGSIDDVRIYNRALSPQEVSQLYQSPYAMFERRPVWMDWTQTELGISIPILTANRGLSAGFREMNGGLS
jgi:hypothetical protein